MRYWTIRKNTTTEEQKAQGLVDGSIESILALVQRSPDLKTFDNQVKFFKLAVKWEEFEGKVLEVEEEDYQWVLKMLKTASYSNKVAEGVEIPLRAGKILSEFSDLPNRKEEDKLVKIQQGKK